MVTTQSDDLINFDEFPAMGTQEDEYGDIFGESSEIEPSPETQETLENDIFNQNSSNQNEFLSKLLEQKGILNPSKILIENENGEQEEVNFNSLSSDEQLAILQEEDQLSALDDTEIEVINFLRENNASLDDVIQYYQNQAVENYINSQGQTSDIDSLSNEELYTLDLQARFPDFTEEELQAELEKELNSPELFNKKIDKLRTFYKDKESAELSEIAKQNELEEQENYQQLINSMVDVASSTDELYDLQLEDSDKQEVLEFLLNKDVNGISEFAKLMNDPTQLFNLAWFALKGKEAFDTIHNYYKKEIDSARKSSTNKSQTSRVVRSNNTKPGNDDDPFGLNSYLK